MQWVLHGSHIRSQKTIIWYLTQYSTITVGTRIKQQLQTRMYRKVKFFSKPQVLVGRFGSLYILRCNSPMYIVCTLLVKVKVKVLYSR